MSGKQNLKTYMIFKRAIFLGCVALVMGCVGRAEPEYSISYEPNEAFRQTVVSHNPYLYDFSHAVWVRDPESEVSERTVASLGMVYRWTRLAFTADLFAHDARFEDVADLSIIYENPSCGFAVDTDEKYHLFPIESGDARRDPTQLAKCHAFRVFFFSGLTIQPDQLTYEIIQPSEAIVERASVDVFVREMSLTAVAVSISEHGRNTRFLIEQSKLQRSE